jgi:hypothetical protein
MPESHPVRAWAGVRCQECGREDGSEERWKAYLVDSDDGGEEVVISCGPCSLREFGDES